MSRGAHLTPTEEERIRLLAATGMPPAQIARTVNRSRNLVWRVLTGRRTCALWHDKHAGASAVEAGPLETAFSLSLETRSRWVGVNEETPPMTETTARAFIETLSEHFKGGRKPSTRALADLERELIADGYSADVLDRAARDMLRTRYARSFPSVAECLAACQVAKSQLRIRAANPAADGAGMASNESRDSEPVTAPESWPRQNETGSRPGLGDGEAVAMAKTNSARAA